MRRLPTVRLFLRWEQWDLLGKIMIIMVVMVMDQLKWWGQKGVKIWFVVILPGTVNTWRKCQKLFPTLCPIH